MTVLQVKNEWHFYCDTICADKPRLFSKRGVKGLPGLKIIAPLCLLCRSERFLRKKQCGHVTGLQCENALKKGKCGRQYGDWSIAGGQLPQCPLDVTSARAWER